MNPYQVFPEQLVHSLSVVFGSIIGDLDPSMVILNRCGERDIFNPAIFIAIPDIITNNPVSNVQTPLPILTVNRKFMAEFLSAEAPCFALGLLEVENRERGFLAMRPEGVIPSDVTALGFNFGHGLLGTSQYEVIQFSWPLTRVS